MNPDLDTLDPVVFSLLPQQVKEFFKLVKHLHTC